MLNDLGVWNRFFGVEDRRLVVAHEVAHQWWGDQVGWTSYRDQWISEAMASYAALLFGKERLGDKYSGVDLTAGWRSELTAHLPDGRSAGIARSRWCSARGSSPAIRTTPTARSSTRRGR